MAVPAVILGRPPVSEGLQLGFRHRPRVRLVRQTEITECGIAAVAMVADYHGFRIDLGSLRRLYAPSLRGAPMTSLIAVADRIGLSSRAVKLPLESIAKLQLPAVLHWDLNHYVVLEEMRGGRALIHDPAGRSRWYPLEEVSSHFTGVALELRPTENFVREDRRQALRISQLWGRLTGFKRALLQVLALSLVMQAFSLALPYYMQLAIDQALPALDQDLLTVLALGFGLFTLINAGAAVLRSYVLLSAGSLLSFGVATNVARRLLRLPVGWFEKRHIGDILSRFHAIAPIQQALTQGMVAALLDGLLAILILIVMFFYSAALSLLALTAFALYLAVRLVSFSMLREAQETSIVSVAKEQSIMIETLRGITTLRLFNKEALRHTVWQAALTDALNARIRVDRVSLWQQTANIVIFGLETILSIWLAVGFVIGGGFSVGMVFAYVAYKTLFLTRGASLVDQSIAFRMLGLHLERLSDIALAREDPSFTATGPRTELTGRIELRGISYRYGPSDPLVLEGVNLLVEPGEHIAITGPSGGGKSTLVKILMGLVEPEAGEVMVDGTPLARFGHKNFHEQVAAVLQDDHLFAGSLADNIALFDDEPDRARIVESARAAAIHEDIGAMPMGYESLVGDMGSALSGGQKQRVLLARALYRRPKILVIDEGTSHLDADHERAVNHAVGALGITRIVIAHRAETIAAAGTVYVLERGGLIAAH